MIKSTEKSTETITKEIAPLQEEINALKVKQEEKDEDVVPKQEEKAASILAGLNSVERLSDCHLVNCKPCVLNLQICRTKDR